ncbi:PEP-CTERM sorting domain-containing protein [Candidatus Poribacteria bacterium]|nr:PEP-CTERM sorting domain-containing protein [Candidatus Poribacteria bacterium]
MKKLFLALVLVVALFIFFGVGSSSVHAIMIDFVPSSQSVIIGDSVDVGVSISGLGDLAAPSLGTFDLDISFNPAILSLNSVSYGDLLLGDQLDLLGFGSLTTTTPGVGAVNLFELSFDAPLDLDTLQPGAFTLATLTFDAIGSGTSSLGLGINALGDALGDPLTANVGSGAVTVTETVNVIPEPSTLLLLVLGLAGMAGLRKKFNSRRAHNRRGGLGLVGKRNILPRLFLSILIVFFVSGAPLQMPSSAVTPVLPIKKGDVFATTISQTTDEGQIRHYDKNLTLLVTLETNELGYVAGMAFDAAGNLYAAAGFFAEIFGGPFNGTIVKFAASNGLLLGSFGSGYGKYPESIVFDAAGNVYVGNVKNGFPADQDIRKFDAAGNLLAQFDVATENRGSDWIDLAADQKTMFYTSEGHRIMRYDVSTGTQLPDFVTLPGPGTAYALRLLGDGGLLVADAVNIKRLNSSGVVIQTYDASGVDGWFALNLDPDGTSFWSADFNTDTFYKFDIATGAVLASQNTGGGGFTLFGLTVAGEITQAQSIGPTIPLITRVNRSSPSSPHAVRGGDPVDLATGSYVRQTQDVAIPTRGLPLELTRTYNSAAAEIDSPLGFGWTHTYNMSVSLDTDTGGLVVRMPDGRLDLYVDDGTGTLKPPLGIYNQLTPNPDGTFTLTTKERDTYNFDASGRLTSVSDRNGNTTILVYSGDQLTFVAAPDGRFLSLNYDVIDHLVSVTDPLGHTTTYAYDANGDLVSTTDSLGGVTSFSYDVEHHMTTLTDRRSNTIVSSTYDSQGRITQQVDANGNVTTLAYNPGETVETDALGHTQLYRFDGNLFLTSVVDPVGNTMTYGYDADGNLTSVTDPLGNATNFSYDANGNVTGIVDSLGNAWAFAYDAADNMVTATDPVGQTTTFTYDAAGNLLTTTDSLSGTTTFAYDGFGQLLSVTDPNGNAATFAYDAQGNLSTIVDSLANETTLTYDSVGRLIEVKNALDQKTAYAYDALNRLVTVTDALGNTSSYAYDANDNLIEVTNPNGVVTGYTYDALNRLIEVLDGAGGVATYAYDAVGNLTSLTDANGNPTQYVYDPRDLLNQVVDAQGASAGFTYDVAKRLIGVIDPLGHATTYTYDALSRLISVVDALSNTISYAYDVVDNLTSVTDADGVVIAYTYDALGRLTEVTDDAGGVTTYAYDAAGNLTSLTDANGNTIQYVYDAKDRLSQVIDPLGGTTAFAYDAIGQLTGVTDPLGQTTTYTYDALNRLIAVSDALGNTTSYAYEANGNLTSVTDAKGAITTYTYDVLDRLTQVTDGAGGVTTYAYDVVGNLTSLTDANGHVTQYVYDTLDQISQIIDPLNRTTGFAYDLAGSLISRTDARNRATQYTYDAINRLTKIAYADGTSVQYGHNTVGDVVSMADSSGTTQFAYDMLSRLTRVTDPLGQQVGYAYDPASNRTSMTYPDGNVVNYAYDANDQLASVTDWLGNTTSYTYDAAGQPVKTTYVNGAVVTNTYDATGRLLATTSVSRTGKVLASAQYAYDALGNPLTVTTPDGVTNYTYDSLYRLTQVQPPTGSPTSYEYDAVGNRTKLTKGSTVVNYTYDAADQLVTANSLPFTYDANGNLVAYGDDSFTYDDGNRLISADIGSGAQSYRDLAELLGLIPPDADTSPSVSNYTYNGTGLRVSQAVNGSTATYLWDLQSVLPVILADGSNRYVYGLDLIAAIDQQNNVQNPLFDGLESVVALASNTTGDIDGDGDVDKADLNLLLADRNKPVSESAYGEKSDLDGDGMITALDARKLTLLCTEPGCAIVEDTTAVTYDAFGARVEGSAPPGGFGFVGQQTDAATGFIYLRGRYYDPISGRFITADPTGVRDPTLYTYALNNPLTYVDLYGDKSWLAGVKSKIQQIGTKIKKTFQTIFTPPAPRKTLAPPPPPTQNLSLRPTRPDPRTQPTPGPGLAPGSPILLPGPLGVPTIAPGPPVPLGLPSPKTQNTPAAPTPSSQFPQNLPNVDLYLKLQSLRDESITSAYLFKSIKLLRTLNSFYNPARRGISLYSFFDAVVSRVIARVLGAAAIGLGRNFITNLVFDAPERELRNREQQVAQKFAREFPQLRGELNSRIQELRRRQRRQNELQMIKAAQEVFIYGDIEEGRLVRDPKTGEVIGFQVRPRDRGGVPNLPMRRTSPGGLVSEMVSRLTSGASRIRGAGK